MRPNRYISQRRPNQAAPSPPPTLAARLPMLVFFSAGAGLAAFGLQMATRSDLGVSLLFSVAVAAGTAAVVVAGGLKTTMGLLNAVLLAAYLPLSLVLKAIMGEPSESHLAAPLLTPVVICLGFCGVLVGTLAVNQMFNKRLPLCHVVSDPDWLLGLFWLTFVVGNTAALLGFYSRLGIHVGDIYVGGVVGIGKYFEPLRNFAVAVAVFYANARRSKRLVFHPLVLLALACGIAGGVGTGSKELILDPLFYLFLTLWILKGWRYIPLYLLGALGIALLLLVVFPAVNYTRTDQFKKTEAAMGNGPSLYLDVLKNVLFERSYREEASAEAIMSSKENKYIGSRFGILSRFCLIGNADNLIAPTAVKRDFTGWDTVLWGLRMLPPRFLYHNKPAYDSSLWLSLRSGMVDPSSMGVPLAFGSFACLYNAFGLLGASLGSVILTVLFYGAAKWFFGNQSAPSVWTVFVVGWWEHAWCEAGLSALIAGAWYLAIGYGAFVASKRLGRLLIRGRR